MNEIKNAAVIGGTSGLGRAVALALRDAGARVTVFGRLLPQNAEEGIEYKRLNLLCDALEELPDGADAVFYCAGLGRAAPFDQLEEWEIEVLFRTNAEMCAKVMRRYMPRLLSSEPFVFAVISSVAGMLASPMFAAYGASKAAVHSLCESVNAELSFRGSPNRILEIAPGSLKGTRFNGGEDDPSVNAALAKEIIERAVGKETLFIPSYEETYKGVLERYHADPAAFAEQSCAYKLASGRMSDKPRGKIGFLSGTFDLFHIGHLNLLRRAKRYCDYLIVGVHPPGSSHKNKPTFIPFEERMEIVGSIRYVDKVVPTLDEDDAMYELYPYDYLFVGSDYKGTERFKRYEKVLGEKGVKIIYFPYTQGTSSTQLRAAIEKK